VKKNALKKRDFDHLFKVGKIERCNGLKAFFIDNSKREARLGIVASKKVYSKAVKRNYAKRIIRENFRMHPIKKANFDLVVISNSCSSVNPRNIIQLFDQIGGKCGKSQ
jgi:ribonuclease P protein component